jgi:hypothetical protein
MRYEVREDVDAKGKLTGQWAIWDTHEDKAFARFSTEQQATDIVNKYYAMQLAAETSSE